MGEGLRSGFRVDLGLQGNDCRHVFLWEKDSERIVQYMKGEFMGLGAGLRFRLKGYCKA